MAGHSKWANTKHRKAAQDARRSKIFTKVIRELVTAAKIGGEDPNRNARLRTAIDKGLSNNMSSDTIKRAIARGIGGEEDSNMETIWYEGYGPNGVAILVECLSDNRNRTASEVRHAFTKNSGNLGTDGSVSYLFHKRGVFSFKPGTDEEKVLNIALTLDADDAIIEKDNAVAVFIAPERFMEMKTVLAAQNLVADDAQITYIPTVEVEIAGEAVVKLLRLVEMLEDSDDVQEVYHNAIFSEDCAQ